jgi:hypothetical protein
VVTADAQCRIGDHIEILPSDLPGTYTVTAQGRSFSGGPLLLTARFTVAQDAPYTPPGYGVPAFPGGPTPTSGTTPSIP